MLRRLKKLWQTLLCFIGVHSWEYEDVKFFNLRRDYPKEITLTERKCKRCTKHQRHLIGHPHKPWRTLRD